VLQQALISNVVDPAKRGSFMSFNGSIQQLGTSIASLIAGFVVIQGERSKIIHYFWVGYLSVLVLFICIVLGQKIFRTTDNVAAETKAIVETV
jgi:MFS transporter, DHA1 family, inner membrane transport protein